MRLTIGIRSKDVKLYLFNVCVEDDRGQEHLIANRIIIARRQKDRERGLIGLDRLPFNYCMLIYPAKAIHMRGVQFPIDVIYMDQQLSIVRVVQNIAPEAVDYGHIKAYYVLELPAGTIQFNPVKISFTQIKR